MILFPRSAFFSSVSLTVFPFEFRPPACYSTLNCRNRGNSNARRRRHAIKSRQKKVWAVYKKSAGIRVLSITKRAIAFLPVDKR